MPAAEPAEADVGREAEEAHPVRFMPSLYKDKVIYSSSCPSVASPSADLPEHSSTSLVQPCSARSANNTLGNKCHFPQLPWKVDIYTKEEKRTSPIVVAPSLRCKEWTAMRRCLIQAGLSGLVKQPGSNQICLYDASDILSL